MSRKPLDLVGRSTWDRKEYGWWLHAIDEKLAIEALLADARKHVPGGEVFEIRRMTPPGYREGHIWAWYYVEGLKFKKRKPGVVPNGNYYLVGQYRA